jgi:exopolysaccharide biosynthesis polyprenyl glycosylphosphotransferase
VAPPGAAALGGLSDGQGTPAFIEHRFVEPARDARSVIGRAAPVSARGLRRLARSGRLARMAVIGSGTTAGALKRELELDPGIRSRVIGRIPPSEEGTADGPEVPVLGQLGELRRIVRLYRIDLVVISGEAPRVPVFDEALPAAQRSFCVCELTDFYEALLGHVPTAEINASWFHYLVHPAYRDSATVKRLFDVAGGVLLALLLLPLIAVFAVLIRLDGAQAVFRQARIGEGGRPITIYKLRTMRRAEGGPARWTSSGDPRVTRIGAFLRRTHLDEAPQLINVLRGEMSLVGPRPEQPEFVRRLEESLPFYQRRHLIKPGITGWAQIRCGYAGSDVGSAWKLCHDLYYMKYRSLRLDLTILVRTVQHIIVPRAFELHSSRPAAALIAAAAMPTPPVVSAASPSGDILGPHDGGERLQERRFHRGLQPAGFRRRS